MEAELDQKEFIVIDNGSGYIKAGLSGQDAPVVVMPTIYGKKQQADPSRPMIIKRGNQINLKEPDCAMEFPIDRGTIGTRDVDWDQMKDIWQYIITEELQKDPTTANILITDSPLNSRENRQKIAQIFFEQINCVSLGIMPTSSVALFSTGRTRGMVVDSGDGLTSIVPVFEGYCLPHAIKKMPIAGKDLTNHILQGIPQLNANQFGIARSIKEKMLVVPHDYDEAMRDVRDIVTEEERSYELPNGDIIKVDKQLRLEAAEILFNPSIIDSDSPSLTQLLAESILKCDNDLRNDMYSGIVLSGGTSMMRGYHERIDAEIKELLPEDISYHDIRVVSDSFRQHAAWIGGSMLASLSTFGQFMTISKGQWDDEGAVRSQLIHKFTFQ